MKRAKIVEAYLRTGTFNIAPAPMAAMRKLNKMAGTYEVRGAMTMGPGEAEMPITGTQTIKPIFGGSVLEMRTEGQPNYKAWGAMAWVLL